MNCHLRLSLNLTYLITSKPFQVSIQPNQLLLLPQLQAPREPTITVENQLKIERLIIRGEAQFRITIKLIKAKPITIPNNKTNLLTSNRCNNSLKVEAL